MYDVMRDVVSELEEIGHPVSVECSSGIWAVVGRDGEAVYTSESAKAVASFLAGVLYGRGH